MMSLSMGFSLRQEPALRQRLIRCNVVGLAWRRFGEDELLWPVWFPGADHPERGAKILATKHARQHADEDITYLYWEAGWNDDPDDEPHVGELPPHDAQVGKYDPASRHVKWGSGWVFVRPMSLVAGDPALLATGVDGRISDALYHTRYDKAMSMASMDRFVAAAFAPPQEGRMPITPGCRQYLERIAERLARPLDEVMSAAREFSSPRWGRYDWETRRLA